MRIALVVERFQAAGGGVEQVAWQVARALARGGDEVHVVAREGAEPDPAETPRGVTVHHLKVPGFWQPLRVLAFSRRAGGLLRRLEPACDVVHGFCRARHQHIYRAGGGSHADYMTRAYGPLGATLRRLSPRHITLLCMESSIFDDSDQLIQCASTMVRDEIATRGGVPTDRLVVIPNGVDYERFDPRGQAADARRIRLQLAEEEAVVWLFAGSGGRRKGLDTALHALALCRNERARLWVAGRDHPARWRRLARRLGIENRVRFLGVRSDMPALYAAADALLLPTRYDAFANVCLEAAASARPVVTSAANGSAEVVADAAVVIDDPEDTAAFARAMDALSDSDTRREMGERGRAIALQHGWDQHATRLRELYQRVAAERLSATYGPAEEA